MHLDGALRVANVMRLLLRDVVDVGEKCRQVVVCHMLEGKLPKLFVLVWVVLGMVPGMLVSSAVAQPHVVSLVRQHESRRFVLVVDEPGVRTIEQAMLQDDRFSSVLDLRALALYPKHSENVAVLSDDPVSLHRIIVVFAIVSKLQLGLGMRAFRKCQQRKQEKKQKGALHYWRFIIYNRTCQFMATMLAYYNRTQKGKNRARGRACWNI